VNPPLSSFNLSFEFLSKVSEGFSLAFCRPFKLRCEKSVLDNTPDDRRKRVCSEPEFVGPALEEVGGDGKHRERCHGILFLQFQDRVNFRV
jgi:hypothetical protein